MTPRNIVVDAFNSFSDWITSLVFYSVTIGDVSIPLIVAWLVVAGFFFTVYLGFMQVRGPKISLDLIKGKSAHYRRTIADVVYDRMIECLGVPEDRFQTIHEHEAENFLFDADYLGIYRSENCIFIQLIFLPLTGLSYLQNNESRVVRRGTRDTAN